MNRVTLGGKIKNKRVREIGDHLKIEFTIKTKWHKAGSLGFFNCCAWNNKAKEIDNDFKNDDFILVDGELVVESWKDSLTEENKYKTLVNVLSFENISEDCENKEEPKPDKKK